MTIHAYTEAQGQNPAYINISERPMNPADVVVTVRSTGGSYVSTIVLTREQLTQLSDDIAGYLGAAEPTPANAYLQFRQMTALLQRQVELMELSRQEHLESLARYDEVIRAYETSVSGAAPLTVKPQ